MRSRVRTAAVVIVAATAGVVSCAGSKTDGKRPVASLAQTIDAQAGFQGIRERWLFATPSERLALEPELRAFRARFSADPLGRVAEAYLAFLALQRDDLESARAFSRSVAAGPPGTTRDLGTLVEGACVARAGDPEAALRLLGPLEGKMLDEFAETLLHETLVESAVRAHRWLAAARYMNTWIRESDTSERKAVRARLDDALSRFPADALEKVLDAIVRDPRPDAWDKEMRAALAVRLGQVAVERADARLARSVIETSRSVEGLADAGSALEQLASLGARVPTVAGQIVGMVVPTTQAGTRARAAQAILGAVEVFRPRATSLSEDAPVLRMREAGAELEDVITSLDVLAQDGASIAIAGFDPESASAAAGWAEAESMPVIVLVRPSRLPEGARFTFVMGEEERKQVEATAEAARAAAPGDGARVLSTVATAGPLVVPCDVSATRAGDPRFPVREWARVGVPSIAVAGSPGCATDLFAELQSVRYEPVVVLGLEALGASPPPRYGGRVLQALAGRLGETRGTALDDSALAAWRGTHGQSPGWYAALGRDAATLASLAVASLPRDTTTDPREVAGRRAAVQQSLLTASAALWTTLEPGFAGGRSMKREIRYDRIEPR